ncbi:protein of unknown function [Enterobacter cancerogenus]|nr:protein of unknown function [Enterobacter cancerogenus]
MNNAKGLFALDRSSTASGVALQLLTDQDIPITFNTAYLLSAYDPMKNNTNYSVLLRAGIYQTVSDVSSVSLSGAVTFTLSYK